MEKRTKIKQIIDAPEIGKTYLVKGWVRTFRSNRFLALNDGSCMATLQCVIDFENTPEETLKRITTGASVAIHGILVESLGKGQSIELNVSGIEILGDADPEKFPLQPKKHSLEFLREIAHLRPRTNTFSAILRVRHHAAFAIHEYFHKRGFVYLHAPIITGSDAEGAGEMFTVTTLPLENPPRNEDGSINWKEDFFGKNTRLTVSGQLEAELGALALSEVYTFGPTFRAENSNTSRHLAEFWMIEPEMAFYNLQDNMDLAEDFLKSIIRHVLEHCAEDLAFLDQRAAEEDKQKPQNERSELGLLDRLRFVLENSFERLSYTEAIEILKESKPNKKGQFKYAVDAWGVDLQSEHERFLVEKHFKKPVILYNYPAAIKAFYMRANEDGKTVAAMDILFPGIGEIIGGSQREERYDKLLQKVKDFGIHEEEVWWYLETRKFGTCEHAGFGLGFERMVQFITGMGNIRDVIPFPRAPKNAEF